MRTNVVLDQELVEQAKELTGIRTTRGVVQQALETLVRLRQQAEMRQQRGKLGWEGDIAAARLGRFAEPGLEHDDPG